MYNTCRTRRFSRGHFLQLSSFQLPKILRIISFPRFWPWKLINLFDSDLVLGSYQWHLFMLVGLLSDRTWWNWRDSDTLCSGGANAQGMNSGCCCPDSNNISCLAADFAERDELLFQGQYHSRQSRRRQDSDGCNLRAGASVRGREWLFIYSCSYQQNKSNLACLAKFLKLSLVLLVAPIIEIFPQTVVTAPIPSELTLGLHCISCKTRTSELPHMIWIPKMSCEKPFENANWYHTLVIYLQVGAEIPMDSDEADEENNRKDGKTLLYVFERGCFSSYEHRAVTYSVVYAWHNHN